MPSEPEMDAAHNSSQICKMCNYEPDSLFMQYIHCCKKHIQVLQNLQFGSLMYALTKLIKLYLNSTVHKM